MQKNVDAYFNLGICYKEGTGVPQDLDKARELFQLVAEAEGSTTRYSDGKVPTTLRANYFKPDLSEDISSESIAAPILLSPS